jgi:hypothetical protein
MSGNLTKGGDFWKAAGIGVLAGAAGYGAGLLMSQVVAPVGAIGGGLTGTAEGAAAGFVGGAGNAWANGASFGEGLEAGLIGGDRRALIGGGIGAIKGGISAYKHGGNLLTGEGATFISDLEENMFGTVDADKSPLNTNAKVTQLLSEKGVNLSDYNVRFVDVESDMQSVEDNTYTYFRSNGRISKVSNFGGEAIPIAGTTISRIERFSAISDIYMSTHNSIPNFMKSLNHEFIHSWQWAKFGYTNVKEWNVFKEASALRYTQLYYPSVSPPRYFGSWTLLLYQWPIFPFVY